MSAGDIEGEAPQDGEVGWGIVLSIARQVLVEHDIERPMQVIFDGPVCAHDAHDILGAVVLAHQEVALDGLVRAPLARDPGDGSEPGKVVRLRHVCDGCDEGYTPLLAPMYSVHGSGGFFALARRCAPLRGSRPWHPATERTGSPSPPAHSRHRVLRSLWPCRDDSAAHRPS